jgi:hypothetical protein
VSDVIKALVETYALDVNNGSAISITMNIRKHWPKKWIILQKNMMSITFTFNNQPHG